MVIHHKFGLVIIMEMNMPLDIPKKAEVLIINSIEQKDFFGKYCC